MIEKIIHFCLSNKLIVFLLLLLGIVWGVLVAPFDWSAGGLPRDPVPVDAIPDIGENQQIVFTRWAGRSPQDVEDQITYPLTAALLGIPQVKVVRSYSFLGFSSIYIVFKEQAEWDWSRAKILEKLNSLSPGTLPQGVAPSLGPDATALGQVFWYTLEGRDQNGHPAEGWTKQELRSIQDFQVRHALQAVEGVAEVASVGGFLREYQVDVDPDAMRAYGVTLQQVFKAVKNSNIDVGARTIEINQVEYVIRGLGFVKNLDDLRATVITAKEGQPVTLNQIASIEFGPALRRGALDKGGAEAVGGVVVARYGANPLEAIQNVKQKIKEISAGLPVKTLEDGRTSKVTLVPFYDRTDLIGETLETLNSALEEEVLITMIVVLLMLMRFRAALLVSLMLPLAVLFAFIAMRKFGVDANIVALSGIAIAIGTIVDMGVIVIESIIKKSEALPDDQQGQKMSFQTIFEGASEVGGAVMTAVLTTIISFLPVFAMEGAEGKLFKPLAFTKTFALIASIIIAIFILPPLAHLLMRVRKKGAEAGIKKGRLVLRQLPVIVLAVLILIPLSLKWSPLGAGAAFFNVLFVFLLIAIIMTCVFGFMRLYPRLLMFFLKQKWALLTPICLFIGLGGWSWSQLGEEFMPPLDEGSFLFMPTTMPHASIGASLDILKAQDMAIQSIPEVENVVGKIGRVESPLDPAPISMVETVITYKPEWGKDENGKPVRNWRPHIRSPNDIWSEITAAAEMPGVTGAPRLQPINARIVMLQSGMRAPMGLKVFGPDLETIEGVGLEIEQILKTVPGVYAESVFADRIVGKPYLEIHIDRVAIARYGLDIQTVQDVIEVAIGGKTLSHSVEGRERYPIRVRYPRERRDSIEDIHKILVAAPGGEQIPLGQLAEVKYTRGPQAIKSEDTFLVGYVIFDKHEGWAEVEVAQQAQQVLEQKIAEGELVLPAGVSYRFTGTYENQLRATKKLALVIPVALTFIFILLYLQFKRVPVALFVFAGVFVAWSGGFVLIWLYNQGWFMNLALPFAEQNLRDLFHINPINLSVAIWVGFLALFGIATDDGVLMATLIQQRLKGERPDKERLRELVHLAACERNRPAMITTATTLIALLPVLMSSGRGSDIMIPMAIPTFGGMLAAILTVFLVPVLYLWLEERRLSSKK